MKGKIKYNLLGFYLVLFGFVPFISYAVGKPENFKALVMIIVNLIIAILPVIVLLALIYFSWGLASFLRNDIGAKKEEAKQVMINGIIGLFVMSSVWGLVIILTGTFGVTYDKPNLGDAEGYLKGTEVKSDIKAMDIKGEIETHLGKLKTDVYLGDAKKKTELTLIQKFLEGLGNLSGKIKSALTFTDKIEPTEFEVEIPRIK
ncbi:MAG: hypothetical protein KAR54_01010 [Candidatus Pacebacteria bacterium]|nr:hypothetical protein [Candidatus Paceibacterota bacterium]